MFPLKRALRFKEMLEFTSVFIARVTSEPQIHVIAERFEARQNICSTKCANERRFLRCTISDLQWIEGTSVTFFQIEWFDVQFNLFAVWRVYDVNAVLASWISVWVIWWNLSSNETLSYTLFEYFFQKEILCPIIFLYLRLCQSTSRSCLHTLERK